MRLGEVGIQTLLRLKVLSKLAASLGAHETEPALADAVDDGLSQVFGPMAQVELVLRAGAFDLAPARGRARAMELLSILRRADVSSELGPPSSPGEPLRAPHLLDRDPRFGHGSIVAAPLIDGATFFGVLLLERDPVAPSFTLADLEALCGVAGQIALRLSHLRRRPTPYRLRVADDMQQAREVQRRFLPTLPPVVGDLRVDARYQPAFAVGGDFYDLVAVGDRRVMAVIGDVAGNGVAAALLMSRISSEFRAIANSGRKPSEILARLNETLEANTLDHGFATAAVLSLDTRTGVAIGSSAGHLPMLVRRANGEIETHAHAAGAPLGMIPSETYVDETFDLCAGDVLMLATDGLVEALGDTTAPSGLRSLASVLAKAPRDVKELNQYVMDRAAAASTRRPDDVAVLTIEVLRCGVQPPATHLVCT